MQTISRDQLKQWKDQGEDFELINVLGEDSFRTAHIPGSDNIPLGAENFEQEVEQKAGGKDKPIVVYCANHECTASPSAAKKLEEAGFSRVYDYEGGVKDWQAGGNEIQGSMAS